MNTEQKITDLIARLAPWLAPGPSAYFVARAALHHLSLPLPIAALIATIIETLGLATIATLLRLYDWNQSSLTAHGNLRRGRTLAPPGLLWLAIAMASIYVLVTITLTILLEVQPALALYAPALFPLLAIVGAVNLAIRSNQTRREIGHTAARPNEQPARPIERPTARPTPAQASPETASPATNLDALNAQKRLTRAQKMDHLVQLLDENPGRGVTELARLLNTKSRTTIYTYLNELETAGRIARNGDGIEVLNG